jgi:hypothetical protein
MVVVGMTTPHADCGFEIADCGLRERFDSLVGEMAAAMVAESHCDQQFGLSYL